MFNKKMLMLIGLLVGSFLVINVGMYFFLNATQPKIGSRAVVGHPIAKTADSTAALHKEAKADTAKHELAAQSDTTKTAAKPIEATMSSVSEQVTPDLGPATPVTEVPKTEPVSAPEQKPTASDPVAETKTAETVTPQSAAEAVKSGDTEQIAKLAKLLETLKPDEAAGIAAELNTDQIVALVMRMKDRTAGKMLAAMPGDQAAKVAAKMSQSVVANRGHS